MSALEISNIILWILITIQFMFMFMLTKTFVDFTKNFSKDSYTIKVGDELPSLKARDQYDKYITLNDVKGKITKLIFLSDHCSTCFRVLDTLKQEPTATHFLVIKEDKRKKRALENDEQKYKFPILRSSKIISKLGIERVPTIVTINNNGIVSSIDELGDLDDLKTLIS